MLESLRRLAGLLPFKLCWAFVFFTAFLLPWLTRHTAHPGEWYPFSNFPMYSDFEKQAYYVYVTDGAAEPVPLGQTFGLAPSDVKKAYDQRLKTLAKSLGKPSKKLTLEERHGPAVEQLREMRDTSAHPNAVRQYHGFRLYQVDLTLEDGRIVEHTSLVGEI